MKHIRTFIIVLIISTLSSHAEGGKDGKKGSKNEALLVQKSMSAIKITSPPRIDGNLSDAAWQLSQVASDFVQYSPYSGSESKYKTEVRIVYDDEAIYIGAMMYDPYPDSIYKELGERDSDYSLNADNFGMDICPYNDGINGASFRVSVSGVQSDRPPRSSTRRGGGSSGGSSGGMMGGGGDSWDAVWESKTSIVEDGWIAEIKIPYSALRFPKDQDQTWGINFWRDVKRNREQSSWNYVNRQIGSTFNHLGQVSNIRDIEPPLRLSLTPYVSGYLEGNSAEEGLGFSYNGGLDLKYGISEAFTLDATLVPDFGQVKSDDQVLNLTPYEVKYNENRPFFMEGTELFDKGDIFYSRRIGSTPQGYYTAYDNLDANESVTFNPSEASLINATKVSGRTKSGLGIGVFNAMTNSMNATIADSETGESRQVMTDPFTNYNMIVLDQSLKNNSYISASNTNVWRDAPNDELYYNANVTATDFRIQDKSRQYSVSGQAALSQKYYKDQENDFGHSYSVRGGKTGGSLRVQYELEASSDNFDPNDMGYLRRNNELQNQLSVSYYTYEPFWEILNTRNTISYSYMMLHNSKNFTASEINFNSTTTFKNYWSFTLRSEITPMGENDYYEPRVDGWFYHRGEKLELSSWISTNRNKKLSGFFGGSYNFIRILLITNQNFHFMQGLPLKFLTGFQSIIISDTLKNSMILDM